VALIGEGRGLYKVLAHKPEGKRPLGRPRHMWIFRNWDVEAWIGSIWLRIGAGGRHL